MVNMDILDFVRSNEEVTEMLCDICDIEILPTFEKPQDEFGHLFYNIQGMTFSRERSGSEYILLEDGSVGFWGSEGGTGRIADNITDFFELVVNCPYWSDYVNIEPYSDIGKLRRFATEIHEEHVEMMQEDMDIQLNTDQKELATRLGITLYDDVAKNVLMKFFRSATRNPRLVATYVEVDGSKHSNSGSLFELE